MAKPKTMHRVIAEFLSVDPAFNCLFICEAMDRYSKHVMSLNPKDHERDIISLNLMQEIAQQWMNMVKANKNN